MDWPAIAVVAAAYLIGAIPFGLVLTRLAGTADIRKIGSGNIGATNVLRTGNKGLALLTLVLDIAKGAAAVLLAYRLAPEAAAYAGAAAFLGHCFPVWLRFKGGKGVATFLGVLAAAAWLVGLMTAATWIVSAFVGRISSLAALISAILAPAYTFVFAGLDTTILAGFMALVILVKHADNITRLRRGEEPRIGQK